MITCRADLHIHTVLSPCGDLDMSPDRIIQRAMEMNLSVIGITDHNTTRQCEVIGQMGSEKGILVIGGAEVTTREEVHCLALFGDGKRLGEFQEILDAALPDIPNDTRKFGYQVAVDRSNNIIYTEDRLLTSALSLSISELRKIVKELDGIFIPAHADRARFGIIAQLGFIPPDLFPDAIEISMNTTHESFFLHHPQLRSYRLISSSDAHIPGDIGKAYTELTLEHLTFEQIRIAIGSESPGMALHRMQRNST